ncbi:MAG: hypothetical protein AAF367_02875 [Pseudomonadota bacterium]
MVSTRSATFGEIAPAPVDPFLAFSPPADGTGLSLIDRRGDPTSMDETLDLGTRLRSLMPEHPDPSVIMALCERPPIDDPPAITTGL